MRWFYSWMAIVVLVLLTTIGTFYIFKILNSYQGPKLEVYIAWGLLCLISTYNIYTFYYDSLLQGKGLIKRSKQIVIVGQSVYLTIAAILIMLGFGLIAIVLAQLSSVVIVRTLSYQFFFTQEIKQNLKDSIPQSKDDIFRAIYPNAVKVGLTSLGGFLVNRSAMIIGSFFLTLKQIGSYGITMQLVGVIAAMAAIYISTYQPKIVQLRVEKNLIKIKELYILGEIILIITFMVGGLVLLYVAPWGLNLIKSKTHLLPFMITVFVIIVTFLETNHGMAGSILLTKNIVPFFKASLLSGLFTVILLLFFFNFTILGLWSMILAPGITQVVYQNWKWPLEVIRELKITKTDFKLLFQNRIFSSK
jgi:O-antigen/teichoic acid export membrane protein